MNKLFYTTTFMFVIGCGEQFSVLDETSFGSTTDSGAVDSFVADSNTDTNDGSFEDVGVGGSGGSGGVAGSGGTAGTGGGTAGTGGGTAGTGGGTAGTGGTGGTGGGSAGSGGSSCINNGGPEMVLLPEGYCIDSTEVTRSQYQAWLNTNPTFNNQTAECLWNVDYNPAHHSSGQCSSDEWDLGSNINYPVVCIDWCDANEYCKSNGKRLCNGIFDLPNEASTDEWYYACSNDGNFEFPYGNDFENNYCNGHELGILNVLPVGSLLNCEGGFDGIFDMSGNVLEWTGSCGNDGSGYKCLSRGGAYYTAASAMSCNYHQINPVEVTYYMSALGFRCCSDIIE